MMQTKDILRKIIERIDIVSENTHELLADRRRVNQIARAVIAEEISPQQKEYNRLLSSVMHAIFGLGAIQSLIEDESVSEIMVNGKDTIYIETEGQLVKTDIRFESDDDLMNVINRIVSSVGRRIDESSPLVDARLEDGSRVNAIIPPLSVSGPVLTIRKFARESFTLELLTEKGTLSEKSADLLRRMVKSRKNIIIAGGTGSGKTSTMNAFVNAIPHDERIITIEDAAEIQTHHPHRVALETRPPNIEGKGEFSMRALVKNALRMRPDRIIVGEIRGAESFDMLQAMNTGHKGSLSTVHANSTLEALMRIETMALMADIEIPLPILREQVIQAVDIVVFQERLPSGKREITHIAEIQKRNTHEYILKKHAI